ncbi:PHD and RING finger domain-containing protein 1 isoform X1 [Lates japonicus]|uniref:PHD and RING finger domain-containing protein 1 isoform X1 n=1 Tax=Lates japonicus TaxID=270547 RepID=A0AAD3MUP0_LATJO|nr:PHD and RING finger domain-containing protein 1 isoform X1 [Lates japonicus]
MVKKAANPRSRIANSLGIVKDKKSSSLPTVYRPSEHTLSSMRADIGAASLSIYGDPFDLDPFVDREEDEQEAHVTSLLEAKRRGISRSALRSHQPVARPVTASLSRRGMDVPQSGGVVEAAPVPDLLGSILTGQSMLLMDSSDVVINRDGSLKATKPLMPSTLKPGSSKSSSSGEASTQVNPGMSPIPGDSSLSLHYNGDLPGSSHSSMNRPLSQSSACLHPFSPSTATHTQPLPHSDLPPRGHPSFQPPRPNRPTPSLGHRGTNGVGAPREPTSSSVHPAPDSKSKEMAPSQYQPKKAPTKPISFSSSSSSTGSPASQSRYSSSSSSSSSSSAVSFRINSSGNSWHSRRLSITSSSASGGSMQEHWREKEDEAKKRQLHRDKQMLLASRMLVNKEQESNNIYDPFNPTLSDSSSSDGEAESSSLVSSSRHTTHEQKAPSLRKKEDSVKSKHDLVHVKTEPQETEISQDEPRRTSAQETISQDVRCSQEYVKVEKEPRLIDTKVEKQTALLHTKVKKEPGLDDASEAESCGHSVKTYLNSESADTTPPAHHSLDLLKTEKETLEDESEGTPSSAPPNCRSDSSASSSAPTKKKQKAESKSDSMSCSKSSSTDLGHKMKTSKASKERRSSSLEADRGRRRDHRASGQGSRQKDKEKDKERSSRRSRSKERRKARSTSESSRSNSSDRTHRKRQRSRSRSKDGRRSRSASSSSSREHSRRKKHKQRSKERNDGRERDRERGRTSKDKRHSRSRSKSRSKSRSSHPDAVSQSHPGSMASAEQPNTAGLIVPVKQEVQQPSDSDDDFNVDVMLDNLDYVKSERTEESGAFVKPEKEVEEVKNDGEQVLAVVGAKSKTQVKRVTWNIQEPEGPQPEKSASKLALYKLKLKQEGARRPFSTAQTSSQDISGAVSDSSRKGAVGPLSASSRSDGLHREGLSVTGQGEADEGDLSRKDKYLKKLHMQERAIEEVKLAIKPFYQRRDINKDEYKEILRKAVQKVCHSKSGEINPVKVGNLVKAYVDKYKHARKHKKGEDLGKAPEVQTEAMKTSDSP